ncbi:HD-GYP domain-containing protein [Priestia flexa]|uniref:HD-GYP domain-containing protein n=1 Tax=Priestia flexa TaxID=86664 RepID=UPI00240D6758|nr:HD-GYP domain-containing protein [Priestia flexa]WEZ09111.1 HD-GYP domain-containing protein [Priestia flexa]
MKLIAIQSLSPGACLAKPILDEAGKTLINTGIPLTETIINRLQQRGVTFVYIGDKRTNDIVVNSTSTIPFSLRKKAMESVEDVFHSLQKKHEKTRVALLEQSVREVHKVGNQLVDEIMNNDDVLSLLTDVYIYDNYVFSHSVNVTLYALSLGKEIGLTQPVLEKLGAGAMLHDVGKMLIPQDILNKPGRLTDEEFKLMKKHTTYGYELLRSTPNVSALSAFCAYQHHERLDGSGYPLGIKEERIHLFSKIIAIADVYDAVTSNRVYRSALLPHEGLEILYAGAGSQFDKDMISAFRRAIAVYPIGLFVTLNDQRKGIVSKQNKGLSDRPYILIQEEGGRVLDKPYEIDLKESPTLIIISSDLKQT